MTTIGTLFSGGEGVGIGARAAGLVHLFGVEWDDKIAAVGRMNGFNTLTGDVRDADLMRSLQRPDVIHASPVCKNASNAKANGEESPEDIATADAVCAYVNHFKPDIFTLENVWGYRTFTAFAHIIECLNANKYLVDYWHLNAANYAVPQTRHRLILAARLNGKPCKPIATHARPDKLTPMFDTRLPWVGWYAAIEDLIDTLPASKFAPWQLERLPDELKQSVIVHRNDMRSMPTRLHDEPMFTVTAGSFDKSHQPGMMPRAFIFGDQQRQTVYADEPAQTVMADKQGSKSGKAWLPSGRVVKMTPRALARFQSFHDSYILPDKAKLACTVIGNAVPPLLYQRVIEAQR